MNRVILQVPISKDLKEKAEEVSKDFGFSSLQEVIRVLLSQLSKRKLSLTISSDEEVVNLSPAAEKRYKKATEDIKAGRNIYKPKSNEEFFKLLRS